MSPSCNPKPSYHTLAHRLAAGSALECRFDIRWQPKITRGDTPNTRNELGERRLFEHDPLCPTSDGGWQLPIGGGRGQKDHLSGAAVRGDGFQHAKAALAWHQKGVPLSLTIAHGRIRFDQRQSQIAAGREYPIRKAS